MKAITHPIGRASSHRSEVWRVWPPPCAFSYVWPRVGERRRYHGDEIRRRMRLRLTRHPPLHPHRMPRQPGQGAPIDPRGGGRRSGQADGPAILLQQLDQLTDPQHGRNGAGDESKRPLVHLNRDGAERIGTDCRIGLAELIHERGGIPHLLYADGRREIGVRCQQVEAAAGLDSGQSGYGVGLPTVRSVTFFVSDRWPHRDGPTGQREPETGGRDPQQCRPVREPVQVHEWRATLHAAQLRLRDPEPCRHHGLRQRVPSVDRGAAAADGPARLPG